MARSHRGGLRQHDVTGIDETYHTHNSAERKFFDFHFADVLRYKDLIKFYTRKNIVVTYRQTVLGPLWLILTPLIYSLIMMFVFGYLAGFNVGNVPKSVFYLFSITALGFFSKTATSNSTIFTSNAQLFSKVSFPRITISYANLFSTFITTCFQLVMAFILLVYYVVVGEMQIAWTALFIPIPFILLALMGQGMGLIFASFVVRYRDLGNLFALVIRLLMYVSAVVYPLSLFKSGVVAQIALFNPLCPIMETMRALVWSAPYPPTWSIIYAVVATVVISLLGILLFNRAEKNFVDTI